MNSNVNTLSQYRPVVKPQDKINLARSKGEYVTKASRNVKLNMKQQAPKVRSLEDEMLWA